jgi:hypothetical protein
MKKFLIACLMLSASAVSLAKLPPLSDEAKAKAAEAAAKTAWAGKVDGYALCKAQDKAAAKTAKSGKAGKATATPPCADPGPFVYTPAVAAAPATAPAAAPAVAGAPAAKAPAAPAAAPAAPAPAAPAKKS